MADWPDRTRLTDEQLVEQAIAVNSVPHGGLVALEMNRRLLGAIGGLTTELDRSSKATEHQNQVLIRLTVAIIVLTVLQVAIATVLALT